MSETYHSKLENNEVDSLFEAILKLRDTEECYRFFDDLCTIPELKSIAQRWMVARMLDTGATYSDISKELSASTATISRVNRCLSYGSGGYRLMLDRSDPYRKEEER
ncbi:MAG: YerC/YecD family TrpR-related protein [Clostridia bacterium]|nr:YerC/YecD family TrpR-related protein [Clostridia bacterium]